MTLARRLCVLEAAAPPSPTCPNLPDDPVAFAHGLLAGAFGPADRDTAHPHHTGWLCRVAAFLGTLGAEHQTWLWRARERDPQAHPDSLLRPANTETILAALDAVMRRG